MVRFSDSLKASRYQAPRFKLIQASAEPVTEVVSHRPLREMFQSRVCANAQKRLRNSAHIFYLYQCQRSTTASDNCSSHALDSFLGRRRTAVSTFAMRQNGVSIQTARQCCAGNVSSTFEARSSGTR